MLPFPSLAIAMISVPLLTGCPQPAGDGSDAGVSAIPEASDATYRLTSLVEGLEHPWGLAFLPGDEGILVTERPGRLRLIEGGRLRSRPIDGLPVIRGEGEGGLLDVALHPRFAENRLIYISYSKAGESGGTTALARGRLTESGITAIEDIFVADAWGPATVNYGGRIAFDRDGFLYLTIGDRRQEARARNVEDHVGTTVRLHDDGSVPEDNPFVGRSGARPEIYSYGHRNPQGMILHPTTGEIWQTDSGPAGGDEINILRAGGDYGWPLVSFGNHYDGRPIPDPSPGDGSTMPLRHWNPGISPSGMMVYTGDAFPAWAGDLFVGSLAARHLNRTRFEGPSIVVEEKLLSDAGMRIRAVVQGPDGLIYLLTDAAEGALLRLEPSAQSPL